jgi:lipoprotein-anchoring transpeptidase ErfK/SrfK
MPTLLAATALSATLTSQPALSPTLPTESEIAAAKHQKIVVDLSERKLYFFEHDQLVKKYRVGIGKPKTPTPIGEGYIRSKGRMIFRYTKGPNKGKIIRWVTIKDKSGAKVVKVPYNKIRGFGIVIPGYNPFQYYLHSTSDESTVDKEISKGCIRMRIEDMLELFPRLQVGAKIIIKP